MNEKYPLPEGWKWVKLGEVCEKFMSGGTPDTGNSAYWDGNIPWITGADITNLWVSGGRKYITCEGLNDSATQLVKKNTVLIVTRTGVGKIGIAANDLCFSQDITGVVCGPNLLPEFLARFLLFQEDSLKKSQRGATIKGLTRDDTESLKIPIAPLPEQNRIIAKARELLQEAERARSACEKQLEAAKALPSVYLREVFESEDAKRWERKRLGEVCNIYQSQTITSEEIQTAGPYKVFGANGVIGYYDKYNHEDSEVLVTCRGATCGTINLSESKSWITGNAMVVHPKTNALDEMFLYWALKNSNFSDTISGAAQPQITRASLSPLEISIPSLSIQHRIATELKEKMTEAEKLRTSIETQLETVGVLPQVILRKAFRGEL